jgi:predicted enzyme related to lactoylglutathione lyase
MSPTPSINSRFIHVNLITQDWKRLAEFYRQVFGCTPIPPERDLKGRWLEDATGVYGAEIHGMHLRLPGHGDEGPTLEVFQYNIQEERPESVVNRPGFAHIAFLVDDVFAARDAVIAAGGGTIGEIIKVRISGVGEIAFVYATDPEGNIIELQQRISGGI